MALEDLDQAGNALARAAVGIDVDLEGEFHGRISSGNLSRAP
jgi:hypothetical protein